MEKFVISLVAAILSLARFSLDTETPEERALRMQAVATYVDEGVSRAMCTGSYNTSDCRRVWTGNRRELVAAVIALGFHESRYAQKISEGKCDLLPKGMQCDNGRARTYWQAWKVACPAAWQPGISADDEEHEGARCAARLLGYYYNYCRTLTSADPWQAAFSAYAGRGCRPWPGAADRRATMNRLLTKL